MENGQINWIAGFIWSIAEYEPDTKLRDTEQIPLLEEGEGLLEKIIALGRTP